jgi:hypothetical protein
MRSLVMLVLAGLALPDAALAQDLQAADAGAAPEAAPAPDAPAREYEPLSVLPMPLPRGEAVESLPREGLGPEPAAAPVEAPGRALRVGMSLLIGAGAGAALAVAGGLLGGATIDGPSVAPLSPTWLGAGAGFALGAPLGVLLAGWLFDGDGAWWATVLGDLVGVAAGAAALLLGGPEGVPLIFALPLGGSVLGYEFSSNSSRSQVIPVLSLGPRGGTFGLAGAF